MNTNITDHAEKLAEALELARDFIVSAPLESPFGSTLKEQRRIAAQANEALDAFRAFKAAAQDGCYDCHRQYGHEHGFPDLIIPFWAWIKISPIGDESGLLCPSCICKRLHDAGISCEGAFMSGSIESVSRPTMSALRRIENIELAIEGRDNHLGVLLRAATSPPASRSD